MVGMLKDQPHNEVRMMPDGRFFIGGHAISPETKSPSDGDLQDGMLAYYLSQAPLTEEHESGIMAREYFNLRDMLEPKK